MVQNNSKWYVYSHQQNRFIGKEVTRNLFFKGLGPENWEGVQYYKNLIAALKAYNIRPVVTLYHWDLPQELQDLGGWLNPKSADWFKYYASICFREFGNDVRSPLTMRTKMLPKQTIAEKALKIS